MITNFIHVDLTDVIQDYSLFSPLIQHKKLYS